MYYATEMIELAPNTYAGPLFVWVKYMHDDFWEQRL